MRSARPSNRQGANDFECEIKTGLEISQKSSDSDSDSDNYVIWLVISIIFLVYDCDRQSHFLYQYSDSDPDNRSLFFPGIDSENRSKSDRLSLSPIAMVIDFQP